MIKIKKISLYLLISLMLFTLTGCDSEETNSIHNNSNEEIINEVEETKFNLDDHPTMKVHVNEITSLLKEAGIDGKIEHELNTYEDIGTKQDQINIIFNNKYDIYITFDDNQNVDMFSFKEDSENNYPSKEFSNALLRIVNYSEFNFSEKDIEKIIDTWTKTLTTGLADSTSYNIIEVSDYIVMFTYTINSYGSASFRIIKKETQPN